MHVVNSLSHVAALPMTTNIWDHNHGYGLAIWALFKSYLTWKSLSCRITLNLEILSEISNFSNPIMTDCNGTGSQNHLFRKWTINSLAKLPVDCWKKANSYVVKKYDSDMGNSHSSSRNSNKNQNLDYLSTINIFLKT